MLPSARNYLTTYEYDGHDRRYKLRFPVKTSTNSSSTTDYEQYGYDANSNVTSIRRRNGQSVTLAYDNLNRLLSRTYPVAADNVSFGYDLLNRRTSANKADGYNIGYVWDNAGRLLSTTAGIVCGGAPACTLSYQYDQAGNRTRITWPDTAYVTTSFDALNRPYQIKEWGTTTLATYAYYPMSLRKTVTLGTSPATTTSYSYNTQGDLASLTHDLAGTAQDVQFSYTRNQAREITTHNWNNDSYAWRPPSSANGTKDYTANGQNQYSTITGASPSYDSSGNLAGDGVWTYGYDTDNRLTSANKTGFAGTLKYDAEGRLRQTTLGGSATHLLYDGVNLVAEYDGSGNLIRRHLHGPGIDEPIITYMSGGAKSWLFADHLGSVVGQASDSGASTHIHKYGPFGETEASVGATRFRYTGQQFIEGLELYHYKARFYSPAQGRFLQTDPIGYADDLNLYSYVQNSPTHLRDPSGQTSADAMMLGQGLGARGTSFSPFLQSGLFATFGGIRHWPAADRACRRETPDGCLPRP